MPTRSSTKLALAVPIVVAIIGGLFGIYKICCVPPYQPDCVSAAVMVPKALERWPVPHLSDSYSEQWVAKLKGETKTTRDLVHDLAMQPEGFVATLDKYDEREAIRRIHVEFRGRNPTPDELEGLFNHIRTPGWIRNTGEPRRQRLLGLINSHLLVATYEESFGDLWTLPYQEGDPKAVLCKP